MNDLIRVLRDHNKPCEHGTGPEHLTGHWLEEGWCPGGKKIVMRRFEAPHPVPVTGAYYLEVSDE